MPSSQSAPQFATVRQAVRNALLLIGIVAILLLRYALRRDTADYVAFRQALEVPLGDRQARLELERPAPDYARVRQGFLQGRNHPDDVDRMARFFRRFREVGFVDEAIGHWARGDSLIDRLASLGTAIHADLSRAPPDSAALEIRLAELQQLNRELAGLEDAFSRSLGAGARRAADIGMILIGATAVLLLLLAGLTEWRAVGRSREAEASLRASETRHRELVEHASFGICRTSVDGGLLVANPALAQMLGYATPDELLREVPDFRRLYRDPAERGRLVEHFVTGRHARGEFEVELVRREGGVILVRLAARALRDDRGRLLGFESFLEDITVRRALETQLRQAQKMEAVGQLTGGIAHDFNNILTVILSNANLAEAALPAEADSVREDLGELKRAARRGGDMIRKLLAFSRNRQLQFQALPLNDLIRASAGVLRRVLPEHIEIRLQLAAGPLFVRTDPAALEQILLNLATNARDAMPRGGLLEITTATVARADAEGGMHTLLEVRDTGEGMTAEVRERLFEPFFTTKAPGRGTGLGLPMVYGMVKQHGGIIEIESAPGEGTRIRMLFPPAEAQPARPHADPAEPDPGSETILIVEDEEPLRRATQRLLERHGYRVLVAADGEEALAVWEAGGGRIDLVLSDVVMPRLGGSALFEELRRRGSVVPFLFMSGYIGRGSQDNIALPEGVPFLPKPWDVGELLHKVREALATRST